jgi:hypothetical protein
MSGIGEGAPLFDGQGPSGWTGVRRPFAKNGDRPSAGPIQTLAIDKEYAFGSTIVLVSSGCVPDRFLLK